MTAIVKYVAITCLKIIKVVTVKVMATRDIDTPT